MSDLILETSPLVRHYEGQRKGAATGDAKDRPKAVYFPRIAIPRGGLIAIEGRSGAGKSTLLNLLAGLDEPTGLNGAPASIKLRLPDGTGQLQTVDVVSQHELVPRHRIGFIFQHGHLLTNIPVGLNVALPSLAHAQELAKLGRGDISDERIEQLLSDLHLEPPGIYRSRRAYQLSGGEAQRVAFARAIAHDPDLVFADEPTSSLDERNARSLMLWLRDWIAASNGKRTVLWVTHHRQLAREMADSILELEPYESEQALSLEPMRPRPNSQVTPKSAFVAARQAAGALQEQADLSTGSATPSNPKPARPASSATRKSGFRRVARMIAFSELFASRRAMKARTGQRRLSSWLSHVRGSSVRGPRAVRVVPAMLSAYSDMRTAIMFVLSGFLLFLAFSAFLINERIQAKALADPLTCRLEISRKVGQAQSSMPRGVVEQLARRPWIAEAATNVGSSAEVAHPPADCKSGPGAFGQILRINYGLGSPINGKCEGARQAPRILVSPRNEPLFRRVNLLDVGKGGNEPKVIGSAYDRLTDNNGADQNDIYLTNETYLRLQESLGNLADKSTPIREVCLTEHENPETAGDDFTRLTLAGIVDDLPTIGIRRYDAYVPDEVYQRTLQARSVAGDFEKAVLYFDPLHHALVADFLAENRERPDQTAQSFHYSTEALTKVAALVANSWVARLFIMILSGVLGLIFLFYLSNWFTSYMETNVKPLSVLRSFGVPERLLRRVIYVRAFTNLIVGIVWVGIFCLVAAAVWTTSQVHTVFAGTNIEVAEYVDHWVLIGAVMATASMLLAVVAFVSWWTARIWVRRNRYVAMNLQ